MRILIIGGTGTIGQAVGNELKNNHEVIYVGYSNGDYQVDICSEESIKNLYEKVGNFDSVVVATGKVGFASLEKMTSEIYVKGLNSKLMGSVNIVLQGLNYINDKGSFTLTSGIINREPIPHGSCAAMVNGALESFVKAAAYEMPRGIRINIVSPTILKESMDKYGESFKGYIPIPAKDAAQAYVRSIMGIQTGKIILAP